MTQRNRVVPMSTGLAKQSGHTYQLKAKFTMIKAGRVETIGPVGVETVVRTLFWIQQGITCDC